MERLQALPRDTLLAMYDAAAEAVACAATLADNGTNPVTEALGGADVVNEWAHFPAGDVIDPQSHSQYYYHAHAAEERVDGEHGHFHIFVRPKRIDPRLQPVALADTAADDNAWVSHLIGISTDATGRVIRLFTTNRWVTGEAWYDGEAMTRMLDRFDINVAEPSPALNRWVAATVAMFRPQIAELIRARDATLAQFKAAHPDSDVFEDRSLQIISEMPVDVLTQIRDIEAALRGPEAETSMTTEAA